MEATFQECRFLSTERFLSAFFRGSVDCGCEAIREASQQKHHRAAWAKARSALQERRLLMLPIGEHITAAIRFFTGQQAGCA
jgi:hypothetical protein